MGVLGDESKFSVETLEAPKQVAPVANAVWKGNYFMSPIAGGVNIQPRVALNSDQMQVDEKGEIDKLKKEIKLDNLAEGQWWWDQSESDLKMFQRRLAICKSPFFWSVRWRAEAGS